ncbi:MAG: YbaK/EbsC family protein [Caldilineaceae bacterium]|nr:YbaK/EbsC family protein [Caldilineaceae bacterium]MBP8105962.1 YbaK/EbsC family protein [Caldilineaceae bacterium]MBP8124902.1 YbaK/EbsC family protein [Caldilineaceae bacterium]MBP9071882.1 YbaK/EbsC family protein [Caldilineaceae bacterium]
MTQIPPVSAALTALAIPHRLFAHTHPVHSLEQAAAERGQVPDQVIRSLLFRLGEGDFVMALVAGPGQISWKALRAHMGQSRLTMAERDEVLRVTGYPIGAVAPFGMPQAVPILVDPSVTVHAEISLGSGIRNTAVILASADLLRALGKAQSAHRAKLDVVDLLE